MNFHIESTICLLLCLVLGVQVTLSAQDKSIINFGDGIGVVAPDSSVSLLFNINLQSRMDVMTTSTDDLSIDEFWTGIRRFRMKFTGFILDPRLTYKLQLAMAPGDVNNDIPAHFPGVMHHALINYKFNNRLTLSFGQTALPGNRQRLNSSSALQLLDRSLASSVYNLEFDFGLHAQYNFLPEAEKPLVFQGAITTGEGRNWPVANRGGLSYTGRLDWYPLGKFIDESAYEESDLEWHPEPKLMTGISYNHNDNAARTGGQQGNLLYSHRDIGTLFADFILKYQGWCVQGAYMKRDSDRPITSVPGQSELRFVHNGHGINFQIGKYFRSQWEIAAQYSIAKPDEEIDNLATDRRDWTLGINRFIKGRAIKLQADFTVHQSRFETNDYTNQLGVSVHAQVGI